MTMMKDIDADTWEKEVKQQEKPVVVDFWHEQCIWCKRLAPIYDELSKEYRDVVFAKFNIFAKDQNLELARGLGISGTPTLKIFCKGREVGEIVGYTDKSELRERLDQVVSKAESCISKSTVM